MTESCLHLNHIACWTAVHKKYLDLIVNDREAGTEILPEWCPAPEGGDGIHALVTGHFQEVTCYAQYLRLHWPESPGVYVLPNGRTYQEPNTESTIGLSGLGRPPSESLVLLLTVPPPIELLGHFVFWMAPWLTDSEDF